jgi:RimJ/RimL family protein N-acetyltransferase
MTSDPIPAARIRLVPLAETDAPEMVRVLSDGALYGFTGGSPPGLEELHARYARQAAGRSPDGGEEWRNWIIRREPDGTAVGYVQATIVDGGTRAEIAWVVGVDWQGQGYATEAARALVGWLDAHGVTVVQAHIHPDHAASAAVARRAGLLPTGHVDDGERRWQRTRPLRVDAAGPGAVLAGQFDVGLHGAGDPVPLAQAGSLPDGGGHAEGKRARGDHLVLADQRRGGHHGSRLDPGPVQHQGARADQAAVLDHAALQVCPVPDHAVGPDHGRPVMRGVHDRAVLHRGPLTDLDQAVVAAEHGAWPHRRPGGELHRADHHRVRVHVRIGVDDRDQVVEGVDGHGITSCG